MIGPEDNVVPDPMWDPHTRYPAGYHVHWKGKSWECLRECEEVEPGTHLLVWEDLTRRAGVTFEDFSALREWLDELFARPHRMTLEEYRVWKPEYERAKALHGRVRWVVPMPDGKGSGDERC